VGSKLVVVEGERSEDLEGGRGDATLVGGRVTEDLDAGFLEEEVSASIRVWSAVTASEVSAVALAGLNLPSKALKRSWKRSKCLTTDLTMAGSENCWARSDFPSARRRRRLDASCSSARSDLYSGTSAGEKWAMYFETAEM